MKNRNGFPCAEKNVQLSLNTHLPTKWVAVDLESGDIWSGSPSGRWNRPAPDVAKKLKAVVGKL